MEQLVKILLGFFAPVFQLVGQILAPAVPILVRAIPTFLVVIALHWYLKKVLIQPLQRVRAERRKRMEGAVEAAEAAVAQAAEKAAAYEHALAQARAGIYAEQEEHRRRLSAEQAAAIEAAKASASAQVAAARVEITAEQESARALLAAESERLADEITQAVLVGSH